MVSSRRDETPRRLRRHPEELQLPLGKSPSLYCGSRERGCHLKRQTEIDVLWIERSDSSPLCRVPKLIANK